MIKIVSKVTFCIDFGIRFNKMKDVVPQDDILAYTLKSGRRGEFY